MEWSANRILFVGNRGSAKRVCGASEGFDLLVRKVAELGLSHGVVDRSRLGRTHCTGSFDLVRVSNTVLLLISFLVKLLSAGTVYMTLASSRLGFFRDALMIWPSRLLKRRLVLHLYGGGYRRFYDAQPRLIKRVIADTLSLSDVIIVEGKPLREQFDFVPSIEDKIRVVPNGLPLNLNPGNMVAKCLSKKRSVRLLYMSNMIESKGYLKVLKACRILRNEVGMEIRCDFCGEFVDTIVDRSGLTAEKSRDEFVNLVRAWGMEGVVTFHGMVRGKLKQELLLKADIFVLPTAYPWEGQPFSIIEALAFGTPVITTRFRGIPEQVTEAYNGFFVEPNSACQISDAVQRIVKDPDFYRKMSLNAIRHYSENFTREVHLRKLLRAIVE